MSGTTGMATMGYTTMRDSTDFFRRFEQLSAFVMTYGCASSAETDPFFDSL